MNKVFIKGLLGASAIVSVVFTFVPENIFGIVQWFTKDSFTRLPVLQSYYETINIAVTKILLYVIVAIICTIIYLVFLGLRKKITLKGNNYSISIEYGDLLKQKNCKRVITFDECYTTTIGNRIEDINPDSLCGQYLTQNPGINMNDLILKAGVKKAVGKSKFQKKERYESGTVVPNGDDLLLAFAKLDERGKGYLLRDEYLECLDKLWKEIEYHYGQKDVCIPILGSGTTIINGGSGASIPQQELLEMIIWSYKLSSHKIKAPYKLRIVCLKDKKKDFSINYIEG